ncbi:TRAP transporter large permease [Microbaculum marinisediminis]|uniref:TRAP transporter large permease protein n=1 Tax=Microbaculum marinisediminis TaxID=2931392 RepID=A0AAW5R0N1_9HYPH|nr:TRAP transporter large permease [Microbaculum sp. A6E488]MCT8973533.1 TRAP transporter large permease [Microbaculum sp. A6E488]
MIESLIGFGALFVVVFLGVPLGFALLLVGLIGFAALRGIGPALAMSGQQIVDFSTNYGFSVLPLFILMGTFIHRAQLSEDLYDAAHVFLGRRRGGLAMATIAACGAFAAVSGSSLATAATMSKVAVPPMRRYGYDDRLATGSVAAGGTLGILIPPSVPLVIYGILTETDIGKLFIAGVLPGLLLILAYFAAIWLTVLFRPAMGPRAESADMAERLQALKRVWAVLALFVLVLGGIYLGVFTPTEAAGIGATGALLFAIARRRLNWSEFIGAMVEAAVMTGMIFLVVFGAMVFANFINLAGLTRAIVAHLQGESMSATTVVIMICVVYLVLGCVFDSMAMLLLTVPVFAAVLQPLGVDLIWFGIVTIVAIEIGLITPPIGMNVFIVRTVVTDVKAKQIFVGVAPFVVASLVALATLIYWPSITLTLPGLM